MELSNEFQDIVNRTAHIPSSVYEAEQELWLRLLRKLEGEPFIVEFGTGWGKTAVSLALACPQAQVYTFDPGIVYQLQHNVESEAEYIDRVLTHFEKAKVTNIKFKVANSLTIDLPEQPIDVLNIDSAHDYETTLGEIKRWVPLVKTGGLIFLHDWEHPKAPGVRQAWDELIGYEPQEIGMTVWEKNPDFNLYLHEKSKSQERGNEPVQKIAQVKFIAKAVCPIVTTAAFVKL